MQREKNTEKELLISEQINLLSGMSTKRESMLIENRGNDILEEIINLKAQTKMLPITMRKLYSYKVVQLSSKKVEEKNNKVIPLVLRKRMLLEKAVNC